MHKTACYFGALLVALSGLSVTASGQTQVALPEEEIDTYNTPNFIFIASNDAAAYCKGAGYQQLGSSVGSAYDPKTHGNITIYQTNCQVNFSPTSYIIYSRIYWLKITGIPNGIKLSPCPTAAPCFIMGKPPAAPPPPPPYACAPGMVCT